MAQGEMFMIDMEKTAERLKDHLRMLTQTIGERSVLLPENPKKIQEYIETFYQDMDIPVHCKPYPCHDPGCQSYPLPYTFRNFTLQWKT